LLSAGLRPAWPAAYSQTRRRKAGVADPLEANNEEVLDLLEAAYCRSATPTAAGCLRGGAGLAAAFGGAGLCLASSSTIWAARVSVIRQLQ